MSLYRIRSSRPRPKGDASLLYNNRERSRRRHLTESHPDLVGWYRSSRAAASGAHKLPIFSVKTKMGLSGRLESFSLVRRGFWPQIRG